MHFQIVNISYILVDSIIYNIYIKCLIVLYHIMSEYYGSNDMYINKLILRLILKLFLLF